MLIAAWVVAQIWLGYAVLPKDRGRYGGSPAYLYYVYFDRQLLAAISVLIVELAAAVYGVVRYVVGNHPRWGWYSDPLQYVLWGVMAIAGVLAVVGLFL